MTNTDPIIFTKNAAFKVKQLIATEENPNLKLRIYVSGGGCSGFNYNFTFDEDLNEDDTVITTDGMHLLVDSGSYRYLVGATIDFEDRGLNGAEFTISNPNSTSTCGCGKSFAA